MSVLASVWPLRRPAHLPPVRLEGARLYLQPPCLDDWADWYAVRGGNESFLKPFEPHWPDNCLTYDFFKQRLKRQKRDWYAQQARYFLIRRNDTGALIGGININNLTMGAARHGSLGYWLDESSQGQGYMSEAIGCVLEYAFTGLGLARVHAACIPENDRSKKLLLRVELQEEGYARGYLQINGTWRDHHLFGITRDEYLRMTGRGG